MAIYTNTGGETSDFASLVQVMDLRVLRDGAWRRIDSVWTNEATATASISGMKPLYLQPETEAHIAVMNTAPDSKLMMDLNDMIVAFKEKGLWERMDILSLAHGTDPRDALLNIREPGENNAQLTDATSSLHYIADVGLKMDQSASAHVWIDSSELSLSRYTQVDAHAWIYQMSANEGDQPEYVWPIITLNDRDVTSGATQACFIEAADLSNSSFASVSRFLAQNTTSGGAVAVTVSNDYTKLAGFMGVGAYSAQHRSYINVGPTNDREGGKITVGGPVPYNLSSEKILIGARYFAFDQPVGGGTGYWPKVQDGRIGGWGIGSRMDYSDLSSVADIINDFFTRRGTSYW